MPQKADKIFHNATIYTVDKDFSKAEAMAIQGDTILEVGEEQAILEKYASDTVIDLKGQFVYPGFIDAHCHFYWLGQWLQQVALNDCQSFDEVLEKLKTASENSNKGEWLKGRGWDQTKWASRQFPNKRKLDSLFPARPVFLLRIDGHAALVNQAALDRAGITKDTEVEGGQIQKEDGHPTGILIDNAIELVRKEMPEPDSSEKKQALLEAQDRCFEVGLTTVTDASVDHAWVESILEMHEAGALEMRVTGMLNANEANLKHHIKKGPYRDKKLHLSAIKLFADGALGSRGAKLLEPYHDAPNEQGLLLHEQEYFEKWARIAYENGYQLNTHAIGDSACRLMLDVYSNFLEPDNDRRWRIEHCQVVNPGDLPKFDRYKIVPSIQPSHAISDKDWAPDRLGPERINHAYAYQDLLEQNGFVAIGSDFPIERHDPLHQFYTAVARKDTADKPEEGFMPDQGLNPKQALKGLTRWAAYANFEEDQKGSLEQGKLADFVVLDRDIMKVQADQISNTQVSQTWIGGELVWKK